MKTRLVNTQDLIKMYPLAEKFIRRMEQLDSDYGRHDHQQQFVARMHRMQELQPCVKDHEHTSSCYSKETVAKAGAL